MRDDTGLAHRRPMIFHHPLKERPATMSISSVEPANQICYIEKPPKPLGSAVNDFIQAQIKFQETGHSQQNIVAGSISISAAPVASINSLGQVTGQIVNTTA
jgi:hypothetical protein